MINKKLRNLMYKYALDVYTTEYIPREDFAGTGLCWLLYVAGEKYKISQSVGISNYPELMKHKPIEAKGLFWFPTTDFKIRIEILKQAIKETNEVDI